MKFCTLVVLLLSIALVTYVPRRFSSNAQIQKSDTSSQKKARELWEKAITAKGGREKLHAVANILFSSKAEYTTHKGKRNYVTKELLCVFPDKTWERQDYRPDVFGLTVEMFNYENRTYYVLSPDDPDNDVHRLPDYKTWDDHGPLGIHLTYLMETKWVKPEPIDVRREIVGRQTVDVIETRVLGKRYDFVLDPKTHLLIRQMRYSTPNSTSPRVVTLGDYTEIDGIQIPQKIADENGNYPSIAKIRLNVPYEGTIFTKPSSLEAGAWKPKIVFE